MAKYRPLVYCQQTQCKRAQGNGCEYVKLYVLSREPINVLLLSLEGFTGLRDAQGRPLDHAELFLQIVEKQRLFLSGVGVL